MESRMRMMCGVESIDLADKTEFKKLELCETIHRV